jgi:hypothetical protein
VVPCPDVDPFVADRLRGVLRHWSADKASCVEGPRHQEFFRVTSTMQDPGRAPPIPPAPSRWRPARRCVFTDEITPFMATADGLALAKAFMRIRNIEVRRRIAALVAEIEQNK